MEFHATRTLLLSLLDSPDALRVYHDGVASEEAWEDFDAAMTDVYADFPHDGAEAVTIDYHNVDGRFRAQGRGFLLDLRTACRR